jgi:ADP-heptose:LPS heptosyltransferase
MIILISPYARVLPENKCNPKNFPYWENTIKLIKAKIPNAQIVQIGKEGEAVLEGVDRTVFGLGPKNLLELAQKSDAWLSVDSFFQHFCSYYKIPNGIVIFSQSDPKIFGYPRNTNLLKDRKYLRPGADQFLYWWREGTVYKEEAFVSAETVAETLFKVLKVD